MHFLPNERVALFIDGANLYSASRNLGFDVDYRNLLEFFRKKAHVIRAYYYSAVLETDEYSPLKPLTDWLAYNGYTLVTKPAKEFTDSAGRRRVKGNMDIEVAVDMLELAPRIDHAICSAAIPISADWWRRCSATACAYRWYPRSAPARRWWLTNFAARRISSWNWQRSHRSSPAARPSRACACAAAADPRGTVPRSARRRVRRGRPGPTGAVDPEPCPGRLSALSPARESGRPIGPRNPDWFNAPVPSFGSLDARC